VKKYALITIVVCVAFLAVWLILARKSVDPSSGNTASTFNSINNPEASGCIDEFRIYNNERYNFAMCIPEEAEVLTQYDAEDKSTLDLIFVQKSDLPTLVASDGPSWSSTARK